jgi:arsenate reductase
MRILVLCTGNSCRSQMAEAFLTAYDDTFDVYSAGTNPAVEVNPRTIQVMNEIGFDMSGHYPKSVDLFIYDDFNYVITVCGGAKEVCPVFNGIVEHQLHIGFDDPAEATGTEEEILFVYRRVRDEIRERIVKFLEVEDDLI